MMNFNKSKVRVLVVDDEESLRQMICTILKEEGWAVEMAANGKLALETLAKEPFHIVISDIQMPEMTGIELLSATKQKYPATEFIVMTSNASLETAMQAIKLGAYDYLTKPFEDLSVVPKKMAQVAEKILLRQQNNELLKRLRKASQDLKLLFELSSQLNGVLEEKALQELALNWLPKLFRDPQISGFWFQKNGEKWEKVQQVSPQSPPPIADGESFSTIEEIRAKLSGLRAVREVLLSQENQSERLLVFEALAPDLADLFAHEMKTCFDKVIRHQDVVSLANRDGLTRLYNHRYFQDRLRQELAQVKRQNGDLSLVLIDVDHFKKINDNYGHPVGDHLLREMAAVLNKESGRRDSDVVARYGGEEFVFVLPFTDFQGAMVKAARVREAVENYSFTQLDGQPLHKVTVSLGVATFPQHAIGAGSLIELADKALYEAKSRGRNQAVGYETVKNPQQKSDSGQPRTTLGSVLNELTPVLPTPSLMASDVQPSGELPSVAVTAEPVTPEPVKVEEAPSLPTNVESPAAENAVLVPTAEPSLVEPPVAVVETVVVPPAAELVAVVPTPVAPAPEVVVTPPAPVVASAPEPEAAVVPPVAPPVTEPAPPAPELPPKEKPRMKRKALGPEVDVDDIFSSIEAALDQPPATSDAAINTVLFANEAEVEKLKPSRGNHGTGTSGATGA